MVIEEDKELTKRMLELNGVMSITNEPTATTVIEHIIKSRVEKFHNEIEKHPDLEIVNHFLEGEEIPLGEGKHPDMTIASCECFKVLNHEKKTAVLVDIESVIRADDHDLVALIEALATGITIKVLGITRIVGYYSRVVNWNSSKTAELRDRRKGNYSESMRVNTGRVALLRE